MPQHETGAQSPEPKPPSEEIHFPNGHRAKWVKLSTEADPSEAIRALGLERPRCLLLLIGGAEMMEPALTPRLQLLVSQGLVRASREAGALILDGGTQAGIMALMGQALADRGDGVPLVGVAPAGLVTWPGGPAHLETERCAPLEPHHSHFVLVDGDMWGAETQTLFELAAALADGAPVAVVLVNGGGIARQETLFAVRRGWRVIVVEGTGRLASELASLIRERPSTIADPVLAEIIAEGDICLFPLDGSPHELELLLRRELSEDTVLQQAWERFAWYDANANRQQRAFLRLQLWSLGLGILGTLLALTQAQLRALSLAHSLVFEGTLVDRRLQVLIVAAAAAVTALVAAANWLRSGSQWILLRAHAEALKREIFRYRCGKGAPGEPRSLGEISCERGLASRMKSLSQQLVRTEASPLALRAYMGPVPPPEALARGDDGLSSLTPSGYLRYRLEDQLTYYRGKIDQLTRRTTWLQGAIIFSGALGTVLASAGQELWVPLTTALVTAISAWLVLVQGDNRLTKYHQAAIELSNLQAWWSALSIEEQAQRRCFDMLVEGTESTLQGELAGWVREMKDVLARTQAKHEKQNEPRAERLEEQPVH